MRVLVAPDKFKGSLSAAEVARCLVLGLSASGAECRALPLADRGDASLESAHPAPGEAGAGAPPSRPHDPSWFVPQRLPKRLSQAETRRVERPEPPAGQGEESAGVRHLDDGGVAAQGDQAPGHGGRQQRLARVHDAHRVDQLLAAQVLQQEPAGAGL